MVILSCDRLKLKFMKMEGSSIVEDFYAKTWDLSVVDDKIYKVIHIGEPNSHIILVFGEKSVAAIDIEEKKIVKSVPKSFANVVVIGDYIYLMKNEEAKSHSGFFI